MLHQAPRRRCAEGFQRLDQDQAQARCAIARLGAEVGLRRLFERRSQLGRGLGRDLA